jgi:hypothetical protein
MGAEMHPQAHVIRDAVTLACHAPSVHNSQPWRWIADGAVLHLFADRRRLVARIDSSGRELLLSCGAAADHLRVAMTAVGWDAGVEQFPDPDEPDHLVTFSFSRMPCVEDAHRRRADAIRRRRTDRLPFAAPAGWGALEQRLRGLVDDHHVELDVIADDSRQELAEASRLTESIRRQDPTYQAELRWWTSPLQLDQGVPQQARLSASEAGRVDVSRAFPTAGFADRRQEISSDRSKIIVLSTRDDTRQEILPCGEALSAVLLECTTAGLATCTLTHLTEVTPSRDVVRRLIGRTGLPQLLIRVGRVPTEIGRPPATPRLPVSEVLEFRA